MYRVHWKDWEGKDHRKRVPDKEALEIFMYELKERGGCAESEIYLRMNLTHYTFDEATGKSVMGKSSGRFILE